jgi:hypothetical protein
MAAETITTRGLQAAVAILTAESNGLQVPQADLLGECPPTEALRAMTVLCGCYMANALPSAAAGALRTAGLFGGRLEADGL